MEKVVAFGKRDWVVRRAASMSWRVAWEVEVGGSWSV